MTEPVCHLKEFFMTRVNVAWHVPSQSEDVDIEYSFDYDVSRHASNKHLFRLAFRVEAKSKTPSPVDYSLDTEIVGFFRFPEKSTEDVMQFLTRLNGCTILYGILRGQLANITGSFPRQKLLLPTVMMENVVNDIEREKARDRQENPPVKKKAVKKTEKRAKTPVKKK